MGTEVGVSDSAQRLGLPRWIFALTIGLLLAGCGGNQVDPKSPEVIAFEACMEEAGYTTEDFELFPPAEELDGPEPRTVVDQGEPDWDLQLQIGACINQSGVGVSVVGDPAAIAQRTESALELTRCMKERGWSEFPDPAPHPAPFDDGLIHSRIDMPQDPEARGAFNADFEECAAEAGSAVGSDHDHDHDDD